MPFPERQQVMQVFSVFCIAALLLKGLRDARLINIIARAAGLPLNAHADQAHLDPARQNIVVFDRHHNSRILCFQARKLDLRRMRICPHCISVCLGECNFETQILSGIFDLPKIHAESLLRFLYYISQIHRFLVGL